MQPLFGVWRSCYLGIKTNEQSRASHRLSIVLRLALRLPLSIRAMLERATPLFSLSSICDISLLVLACFSTLQGASVPLPPPCACTPCGIHIAIYRLVLTLFSMLSSIGSIFLLTAVFSLIVRSSSRLSARIVLASLWILYVSRTMASIPDKEPEISVILWYWF